MCVAQWAEIGRLWVRLSPQGKLTVRGCCDQPAKPARTRSRIMARWNPDYVSAVLPQRAISFAGEPDSLGPRRSRRWPPWPNAEVIGFLWRLTKYGKDRN